MIKLIRRIRDNEKGISAVEYLIAIGVVALVIIAGFEVLGNSINAKAGEAAEEVQSQITFGGG